MICKIFVAEELGVDIEDVDPTDVIDYIISHQDLMDTLKSAYEIREYYDGLPRNEF